ncbi:hypothetical protein H5410_040916 [Solanum commersonii]|uniref:Uncharacterized protein n=1 Tax=Solanum commersonii TaxID=4109 RepID=A0A9J5XRI6_SOLCO|nr:hypothetical protein H5410_040916 [Solanum commersonii]
MSSSLLMKQRYVSSKFWRREVAFVGFEVPIQMDISTKKMIFGVPGTDPQRRDELIKNLGWNRDNMLMHSANHKFDRPGEAETSIQKRRCNNYSQVSDGVAAVLLMKRSIAMQKGLLILSVFSRVIARVVMWRRLRSCFPDAQRGMVIAGAEGHHNVGIQLAREMNHNFLGCAENALGIREWLESKGHQYIVTPERKDQIVVELDRIMLIEVAALWIGDARDPWKQSCLDSRIKMDSEPENQIGAKFEEDLDKMMSKCDIVLEVINRMIDVLRNLCCQNNMIANEVFLRFLEISQGPSVALHAKPSYDSSHSGTTIDAQLRYAARTKDIFGPTCTSRVRISLRLGCKCSYLIVVIAFGDHTPENLLTDFGLYDPHWLFDIATESDRTHITPPQPTGAASWLVLATPRNTASDELWCTHITYHDKATQTETEEEDTIEKILKAITTLCIKVDSMDKEIQKLKTNEDNLKFKASQQHDYKNAELHRSKDEKNPELKGDDGKLL